MELGAVLVYSVGAEEVGDVMALVAVDLYGGGGKMVNIGCGFDL